MRATTAERGHAAPGEAARAATGEAARAAPGEAGRAAPGEAARAAADAAALAPRGEAARTAAALAVEPPTGWQFVLEGAGQRAVVTEVGATLRSWRVGGRELLDTFPVDAPGDGFRGKVLLPWPNRIRGGRYVFGGAEHRLPVTEPERDAALHGLVLWSSFRPLRRSAREIALTHRLHPQPGYPFTLDIEVAHAE